MACGYVLVNGILNPIGTALGDAENTVWIAGGWSVASAVSFSIAGGWSDILGRRWVVLSGQVITLIGAVRWLSVSVFVLLYVSQFMYCDAWLVSFPSYPSRHRFSLFSRADWLAGGLDHWSNRSEDDDGGCSLDNYWLWRWSCLCCLSWHFGAPSQ